MKLYTKTGDKGDTGLFGGVRLSKASPRVDTYGTVDELNATLGVVRATGVDSWTDTLIASIQSELFTLGAELATAPGKEAQMGIALLADDAIGRLESAIDQSESGLPPLKTFILPGGSPAAAALHFARTVCRRAERGVVALRSIEPVRELVVIYLNRLSDLLFSLARRTNFSLGVTDIPWSPR